MVATLLCMAVALMALAPLSRLGNRSIAHWIDGPTLQRLHHISVAWWLLTVAAAFVLFWAAGPALHDARPATAALAALLIGLLSTLLVLLARIDEPTVMLICSLEGSYGLSVYTPSSISVCVPSSAMIRV